MANLQQESEMDPTKKQYGGGPGRGLCQWEIGARWDQLLKYAWSQGKLPSALDTQLEYLWKELTELKETRWIRNFLDDYGGIGNLKKMNTYQAVIAFEESFERAGDPAYPRRFAYADQIYHKFTSGVERARA